MAQHPLIAEHQAKFGVVHTSLGRNLRGNRVGPRKTSAFGEQGADESPLSAQPIADGPLSHADQEKRLADTKMWVPHRALAPAKIATQGASAFASKIHLPDPHARSYAHIQTSTDNLREIGRAYDKLPTRDPSAVPHFAKMRDEILHQHDHLTNAMGIKTEVVHHDPYPTVHHMVQDVVNNKRIKVLSTKVTGGHDFLDDDTNDKFRAVHDVFGHAATGRGFDAHGEEAAWLAHSQMFTPHARGAMSSETRGQNSALHINGQFQAQKTALLPRHMWDDTAVSKHLSAKQDVLPFEQFHLASLTKQAHDSGDGETIYHCPFCGSGQVIARSDRTIECEFCHTCFTVQVQPQYPAFPQTVNGVPVQVPGMPGQMGVDPAGAGGLPPGADPNADPNANPFGGDAAGDEEEPVDDDEEDSSSGNPFAASLRTTAGKALPVEDYLAHLALKHTTDRDTTLAAVKGRRG